MFYWCVLLLSCLASAAAVCNTNEVVPGLLCNKQCCSETEELALLDAVKERFYYHTTQTIQSMLNHNYPEQIFYDMFYPHTPRYAIPQQVISAAKHGHFDTDELINFELTRKMGINSFTSARCKRTSFIQNFIKSSQLQWNKSHAIYRALLIGDEIKKEILSFPLHETCFEHVFKNGMFNDHSCNSCGENGVIPNMRTCTSLCENIVNGCYYMLTRVLSRQHQPFKGSLIKLLKERARDERALLRHEIEMFLTDQDIIDGVACSGLSSYEVEYRLERLLEIPKLGRQRYLSNPFRILLQSPEAAVNEFLPIQPNALNLCRNKGHLLGNSDCFNGTKVDTYTEEAHPVTPVGQKDNAFKSFGGNRHDYERLATLMYELRELTKELQYES